MQELKRCPSDARLDSLMAKVIHPGVINTNLWRYAVGKERLAKIKDGRGMGLLALDATRLFAKTPEEGPSMQGHLAATSNNVVKGAFYKEMKEKGDLPLFTKDDKKAREL